MLLDVQQQSLSRQAALAAICIVHLSLIGAVLGSPLTRDTQEWPIDVPKGSYVVLKIPGKIIGFERVAAWSGSLNYGTVIGQSATTGIVVGGLTGWRTSGWTLMRQLTIEKIARSNHFTEVELRDPLFNVRLRFDTTVKDLNAAFREVVFVGLLSEFEATDYYQQEVVGKVLPLIFTGALASIPTKAKLRLLSEVKFVDSAIRTEKYKGESYLVLNAGFDVEIYNTIRMDQAARIANALNQRVLSYIKRAAKIINFHPEVDGIKVEIAVPYKNFVTEYYSSPRYDAVEIYALLDSVRQFADDELTNQEFVEEAVLLVNGNRHRIPTLN